MKGTKLRRKLINLKKIDNFFNLGRVHESL